MTPDNPGRRNVYVARAFGAFGEATLARSWDLRAVMPAAVAARQRFDSLHLSWRIVVSNETTGQNIEVLEAFGKGGMS